MTTQGLSYVVGLSLPSEPRGSDGKFQLFPPPNRFSLWQMLSGRGRELEPLEVVFHLVNIG